MSRQTNGIQENGATAGDNNLLLNETRMEMTPADTRNDAAGNVKKTTATNSMSRVLFFLQN